MIELTDKKRQLSNFKSNMFNKTLTMFEWDGLPDTLPAVELEKMLQINGFAVIAKYQGDLYAFNAGFSGQNAYGRPTQALINNPALGFHATLTIDDDCVVIQNDDMGQGLRKVYEKYGQLLIENEITMLINDYNKRIPFTISASDDTTIASAKAYLQKIIDGSIGVIGENKLFKSLNINQSANTTATDFADLYGYQQFLVADLNNLIGLATNNNMKRERLTSNEIEINKNSSYPLVDNMLRNRQTAVDKINSLFGTDITIEFSSIWGGSNVNDNDDSTDNGGDDETTNVDTTNDSAIDRDFSDGELDDQEQEQAPDQEQEQEKDSDQEKDKESEQDSDDKKKQGGNK